MGTHLPALLPFVLLAVATGCPSGDSVELFIDLRTDFRPGVDFTRVDAVVVGEGNTSVRPVSSSDSFLTGGRVVELSGLAPSAARRVAVTLVGIDLTRIVLVDNTTSTGTTVAFTRSCLGVECDDAIRTSCLGGRCVEETCLTGAEPTCPTPACASDTECPTGLECEMPSCSDGVCYSFGACPVGEYCTTDAGGAPACVLVPEPIPDGGIDAGSDADADTGTDASRDSSVIDSDVDGARDTGIDGGDAATDSGPPPCMCEVPGDVCRAYSCIHGTATCSPVVPCPSGYSCFGSECVCADEDACGLRCVTDPDCPTGNVCRVDRCRPAPTCRDFACPAGQYCRGGRCAVPATGAAAVGASCSADSECATGLCQGVCLERCASTDDCGAGLQCEFLLTSVGSPGERLGCTIPTRCPSCPGATFCAWDTRDECSPGRLCRSTADCLTGEHCAIGGAVGPYLETVGTCVTGALGCGGTADALVGDFFRVQCTNRVLCAVDADCGAGFTCAPQRDVFPPDPETMGGICVAPRP